MRKENKMRKMMNRFPVVINNNKIASLKNYFAKLRVEI